MYTLDDSDNHQARLKVVLLRYEVNSSWWAGWISADWLQEWVSSYYARKVNRKYERWAGVASIRDQMGEGDDLTQLLANGSNSHD